MTTASARSPTAFISWAHSDDAWQSTIAHFAVRLRDPGVDAELDLFHAHEAVDWSTYGANAIRDSDFVLIAASARYKRSWEGERASRPGAGAAREANVLKDLFDREPIDFTRRVLLVVLPGADVEDVPRELASGLPRFVIRAIDEENLEDLVRRLTGQPAYVRNPLGRVPILPSVGGHEVDAPQSEVAGDLQRRLSRLEESERPAAGGDDAERDPQRVVLRAALDVLHEQPQPRDSGGAGTRPRRDATAAVLLGCMMGRSRVYCGALATRAGTAGRIPPASDIRILGVGRAARLSPEDRGSEVLYDSLATVIVGVARDLLSAYPSVKIASLGIGTPGVIEPGTGHIGHIELERASSQYVLDRTHVLDPVRCDCGTVGFHFDPMANFAGLRRIAESLAADTDELELLAALQDAHDDAGSAPADFYRECFPRLLGRTQQRASAEVSPAVLARLEEHPAASTYFERVLGAYAGVLSAGIATLVEIFDPGNVVLCGPMIDALRTSETWGGDAAPAAAPRVLLAGGADADHRRPGARRPVAGRGAAALRARVPGGHPAHGRNGPLTWSRPT